MTTKEEKEALEGDERKTPQEQALEGLMGKMGDANKVALHLLDENYRLRNKNRELQEKQVPEGKFVVTAEEKTLLDTYKALGTPEALQQNLQELQTTKRNENVRAAAEASGFKSSVLSTLLKDEKLELHQEMIEGKQVSYAVVLQEGKTAVRLTDYAQEVWSDFLPALQAQQAQSQGDSHLQTTFPRQVRGEKLKAEDPVTQRIAVMQERARGKNPLIRE